MGFRARLRGAGRATWRGLLARWDRGGAGRGGAPRGGAGQWRAL